MRLEPKNVSFMACMLWPSCNRTKRERNLAPHLRGRSCSVGFYCFNATLQSLDEALLEETIFCVFSSTQCSKHFAFWVITYYRSRGEQGWNRNEFWIVRHWALEETTKLFLIDPSPQALQSCILRRHFEKKTRDDVWFFFAADVERGSTIISLQEAHSERRKGKGCHWVWRIGQAGSLSFKG